MNANLKLSLLAALPFRFVGNDYPSAFIPQLWANESIAILEENMVMGNLVHRDFENVIASYGDTVNTRKPGEFVSVRKGPNDQVTVQSNTATNVPVVLNQQLHTSFLIRDADQSKSFKDLVIEYLRPAMLSVGRQIDQIVGAQVHQFYPNGGGHLNGLTGNNAQQYMLESRQILNVNKAYVDGRNLVLGSIAETALLSDPNFTQAYAVGDDGTALREASLGRKYGFDIFMAQNTPYVMPGVQATVTGAVNHAGGYVAGTTTIAVTGFSAAIANGSWLTIAGDDTPQQVVSTVGGATPTSITIARGLTHSVAQSAVVTIYTPDANTGAQVIGYSKFLTVGTSAAQVGQAVTFGTIPGVGSIYGIIGVNGNTILLDRPLEENVANGAQVNYGPAGSFNFAFHRNAIALVNRPLALPMPGTGARAAAAQWNGLSMRVTMVYDGYNQGHLVTVDTLLGVKVLDTNLGAVMFG